MANTILLKGDLGTRYEEYTASGIFKPGHILQVDTDNKVLKHAVFGGPCQMIAQEFALMGKGLDDAYAVGDTAPVHRIVPNVDLLNFRVPAGAAAIVIGDRLISNGDGCLVKAVGPSDMLYSNTAASAAVTNTVTETAFDKTYTFPANTLKAGDVIHIRTQAIATATNSTDTLTVKLKIGSTVVATTGALDVADNDLATIDVYIFVRTVGASGTIVGSGFVTIGPPASATTKAFQLASTAIDTTATQLISVTGQWSVASASNSVRLDTLVVEAGRSGAGGAGHTIAMADEALNNSVGVTEAFVAGWAAVA